MLIFLQTFIENNKLQYLLNSYVPAIESHKYVIK